MEQKIKHILIFYVSVPLILGLIVTYSSGNFVHPLDANDWYRYGFPVGWRNTEGTGEGHDTPIIVFYSSAGFGLDVFFWYCATLVIIVAANYAIASVRRGHEL